MSNRKLFHAVFYFSSICGWLLITKASVVFNIFGSRQSLTCLSTSVLIQFLWSLADRRTSRSPTTSWASTVRMLLLPLRSLPFHLHIRYRTRHLQTNSRACSRIYLFLVRAYRPRPEGNRVRRAAAVPRVRPRGHQDTFWPTAVLYACVPSPWETSTSHTAVLTELWKIHTRLCETSRGGF